MASPVAECKRPGDEPGSIRIAETPDGHKQVERLQSIEPHEHCYRYMMLSSPMPVKDYVGEFRVHRDGASNSTVSRSNDFQVTSGEKSQVTATIREFLNAGVQNLRKKYS